MSRVHRIKCGNVNCYVVENGAGGVLIDTGKKESVGKVLEACRSCHVKLIVLTHGHFDHAENAAELSKTLGIPIGMHEKDCGLIRSNASQTLVAETFLGKLVLSASLREFSVRAVPEFSRTCCCVTETACRILGLTGRSSPCQGIRKAPLALMWKVSICLWATL